MFWTQVFLLDLKNEWESLNHATSTPLYTIATFTITHLFSPVTNRNLHNHYHQIHTSSPVNPCLPDRHPNTLPYFFFLLIFCWQSSFFMQIQTFIKIIIKTILFTFYCLIPCWGRRMCCWCLCIDWVFGWKNHTMTTKSHCKLLFQKNLSQQNYWYL